MARDRALLIGSLTSVPEPGVEIPASDLAWALEWRADLLGSAGSVFHGVLGERRSIFTLRSHAEGGRGPDSPADRLKPLCAAGGSFDFVDLEADRDLEPEVLAAIPAEKRIISWHGDSMELVDLRRRFEAMQETPARYYKLVPAAESPREAIPPLAFLHSERREDVISFASGESGAWSRLLAPRLGAPVVYAQAQEEPAAPGQLSLAALGDDYGLPALRPVSKLMGVVGRPVLHSLSPRLHNLMYRRLGLDRLYVPFHVPVFGDFWLDVVESGSLDFLGFELCGLSVTAPFKEIAMAVAGAVSPRAEHIGAANSLAKRGRVWEARCTDPEGVVAPLLARGVPVAGSRAAVLGAGGAGRAAVDGLSALGAKVTLANRSPNRGRRVAFELRVDFTPLEEFEPGQYDIVVNATPVGAGESELPFDPDALPSSAAVVDLAYRHDGETGLVRATRDCGRIAIDGKEVLLYQAAPQFQWMNDREFDVESGRLALALPPLVSQ